MVQPIGTNSSSVSLCSSQNGSGIVNVQKISVTPYQKGYRRKQDFSLGLVNWTSGGIPVKSYGLKAVLMFRTVTFWGTFGSRVGGQRVFPANRDTFPTAPLRTTRTSFQVRRSPVVLDSPGEQRPSTGRLGALRLSTTRLGV